MNKNTLNLISKLVSLFGVIAFKFAADTDIGFYMISVLAFSCLFLTDFLFSTLRKNHITNFVCILICLIGCFYLGIQSFFPPAVFLMVQLIEILTDGRLYYQISSAVILLMVFIFRPDIISIILTFTLLTLFVFARHAVVKLNLYKETSDELRKEIAEIKKKLSDMNSYTKTLREMTVMEERNRFASKIHDELGHSISGSIILLEGSRLNLQKNPEQAEKSIGIAVENLRNGVDNIRKSLREERPDKHSLGLSEIKEKLENFKVTYNRNTTLTVDGDINKISIGIWICLQENLTEVLTNTIKHSDATEFAVKLAVHNKIIRAEFCDNGKSNGIIKRGLGLDSIEERTVSCDGKCLFQNGHNGFSVTCIFMI